MKRTISVMLGKGSINHNSRKFIAENIDSERTQDNICYCDTPIKDVYHQLFDDALERYNAQQSRKDRRIDDYYEKIRTSKQEKLFYEVIIQVGNKDDMAVGTDEGELAEKILDGFMEDFQNRNPNLHVFSAHLHMDEATPHLHIDFVPFTTGSKRGLDTRVSLKQALAAQGFTGGSRSETEWSQWVKSEKEALANVMERYDVEWQKLGTHDEHLSVLNYKKEQRAKEVAVLDEVYDEKQDAMQQLLEQYDVKKVEFGNFILEAEKAENRIKAIKIKEKFVFENARKYDEDPEYQLTEPKPLMSVKTYHDKIAVPLVNTLKSVIRGTLLQIFEKTRKLQSELNRANNKVEGLTKSNENYKVESERLHGIEKEYDCVKSYLGEEETEKIVREAVMQESLRSQGGLLEEVVKTQKESQTR